MVSQSRLYFALLASVATMAFWMGMWSSTVSQNSKFTNPKPYRVILYYSGVENSSQISSGGSYSSQHEQFDGIQYFDESSNNKVPPTKNVPKKPTAAYRKAAKSGAQKLYKSGKFGKKLPPPVARSLFSFASLRPGAKKNPFTYGAKLISHRLEEEELRHKDFFQFTPPKSLVEIPAIDVKWKIAPEFSISDKIPVENAKNILIATSWRSGSTFLGDLLNHYPGTFYSFEPIHYIDFKKHQLTLSKKWRHDEALKLMRDIYKCDFSTNVTTGYLKHVSKSENQFLLRHNGRVWKSCTSLLPSNVACFMPEFLNRVCPLFPTRLIKTVRLRMTLVEELLRDADLSLKVIFLVRDPRGVMNSRDSMDWCSDSSACGSVDVMCKDLFSDVRYANELNEKYPNRLLLVRYEDLSMEPYHTVDKMINFLNLPQERQFLDPYLVTHTGQKRSETEWMEKFVKTKREKPEKHPPNKNDGPYGTKRKSSEATAFKWTHTMKQGEIQEIEEICEKPMEALGYAKFDPKITEDQEMLTKSADEIWPYFSFDHHQSQDFEGQFEEELSNVMNGKSKLP